MKYNSNFLFGVEIECLIPVENEDDIIALCENLNCQTSGDGSIREEDDMIGVEIKTPPLNHNAQMVLISKLCEGLGEYEARVNPSCGLHVHASNPLFTNSVLLKRIIHTWLAFEDVLIATQPSSRLNNNYARRLIRQYLTGNIDTIPRGKDAIIDKLGSNDRYYALNLSSLSAHGTLECRLHAGTVEADKINNWITLLKAVYSYCMTGYDVSKVDQFFKLGITWEKIHEVFHAIKLDPAIIQYYEARIKSRSYEVLFTKLQKQQFIASEAVELQPILRKANELRNKTETEYNKIYRQFDNRVREVCDTLR
jgi:hypothetical protein